MSTMNEHNNCSYPLILLTYQLMVFYLCVCKDSATSIYPINTIYRGVPQRFDKNHINYKVYFIFKPKLVQLSPVQAFSDTFELADGFVVYKQETKKGGKFRIPNSKFF